MTGRGQGLEQGHLSPKGASSDERPTGQVETFGNCADVWVWSQAGEAVVCVRSTSSLQWPQVADSCLSGGTGPGRLLYWRSSEPGPWCPPAELQGKPPGPGASPTLDIQGRSSAGQQCFPVVVVVEGGLFPPPGPLMELKVDMLVRVEPQDSSWGDPQGA